MLALGKYLSQRQGKLPPPAPAGTPLTDLQGVHHRSPPHAVRGCSHISCTELHTKATTEELKVCHHHAISVTAHVPVCEPRLNSLLGNSFKELRKKLTHFVAGFCPLWDTTLSALKEPGSLRHCQAPMTSQL